MRPEIPKSTQYTGGNAVDHDHYDIIVLCTMYIRVCLRIVAWTNILESESDRIRDKRSRYYNSGVGFSRITRRRDRTSEEKPRRCSGPLCIIIAKNYYINAYGDYSIYNIAYKRCLHAAMTLYWPAETLEYFADVFTRIIIHARIININTCTHARVRVRNLHY